MVNLVNKTLRSIFKKLDSNTLSLVLTYQEINTENYVLIISGPTLNDKSQFECIDVFVDFIYNNTKNKDILLSLTKIAIVHTEDEAIRYLLESDINSLDKNELEKLLGPNINYESVEVLIKNPEVLRKCEVDKKERQARA